MMLRAKMAILGGVKLRAGVQHLEDHAPATPVSRTRSTVALLWAGRSCRSLARPVNDINMNTLTHLHLLQEHMMNVPPRLGERADGTTAT